MQGELDFFDVEHFCAVMHLNAYNKPFLAAISCMGLSANLLNFVKIYVFKLPSKDNHQKSIVFPIPGK